MQKFFEVFWSHRWFGLLGAAGLATIAGLASAWLTPRGPVTTAQALLSIVVALLVGMAAGFIMGSRWSMFIVPGVFILVFELARLGVDGPTVDSIQLGSIFGVIAFIVGRLVHGLLVLAPMILGTVYGSWLAGRTAAVSTTRLGVISWLLTSLAAFGIIAFGVLLTRQGRTPAIFGPDGGPLPGSIAELTSVEIGGVEQVLMIRGRDINNPVLLYLAGGPGGTDLGAMRADVSLEQNFVVVTWDQRGTGKSYPALDQVDNFTLEQMVSDTLEVTNYLRERFDEDKIYLVGNSWGTFLGVLAVEKNPESYHAFVGTGQMVSIRETDVMFYQDTLAWAEETGNQALLESLRENGPPPYTDLLMYDPVVTHEHDWNPYPYLDPSKEMPSNLFVPENTLMDRINGMRGLLDTFAILYPQIQDVDFRQDVKKLDVPVYIVLGKYEARGRATLAEEWFEILEAPSKELILFEQSGHRPLFEEPGEFAKVMDRVLEETNKK